jgi:hypothetical protein
MEQNTSTLPEGGGGVVQAWGHKPDGTIWPISRSFGRKSDLKKPNWYLCYPSKNAHANAAAKAPKRALENVNHNHWLEPVGSSVRRDD